MLRAAAPLALGAASGTAGALLLSIDPHLQLNSRSGASRSPAQCRRIQARKDGVAGRFRHVP
jgi:hypothetical protein